MGDKSGREREALRREYEESLKSGVPEQKQNNAQKVLSEEEQFDAGEKFIKDKGCWEPYMRAVKCINRTGDWSQCPEEVCVGKVTFLSSRLENCIKF